MSAEFSNENVIYLRPHQIFQIWHFLTGQWHFDEELPKIQKLNTPSTVEKIQDLVNNRLINPNQLIGVLAPMDTINSFICQDCEKNLATPCDRNREVAIGLLEDRPNLEEFQLKIGQTLSVADLIKIQPNFRGNQMEVTT
jgi:hypothetical protein